MRTSTKVSPTGILYKGFSETADRPLSELQLRKAKLWELNTSKGSWMDGLSKEIYSPQRSQPGKFNTQGNREPSGEEGEQNKSNSTT